MYNDKGKFQIAKEYDNNSSIFDLNKLNSLTQETIQSHRTMGRGSKFLKKVEVKVLTGRRKYYAEDNLPYG